jgi:hypothetical protein
MPRIAALSNPALETEIIHIYVVQPYVPQILPSYDKKTVGSYRREMGMTRLGGWNRVCGFIVYFVGRKPECVNSVKNLYVIQYTKIIGSRGVLVVAESTKDDQVPFPCE